MTNISISPCKTFACTMCANIFCAPNIISLLDFCHYPISYLRVNCMTHNHCGVAHEVGGFQGSMNTVVLYCQFHSESPFIL